MSGEAQVWNFGAIEGGAGEVMAAKSAVDGLLDEGKASLSVLQSVWGGSGSEAYQAVQVRWDTTAAELNTALLNLAQAGSQAGQTMAQTESSVTGMFG